MTDTDFGTFDRAFGRVLRAFRVRLGDAEREELTKIYFRALDSYELGEVLEAGKACIHTAHKFPLVADWREQLDTRPVRGQDVGPTCRQMTATELEELTAAERARYEGPVCACAACAESGIARPVRYVPTIVNGREDRAYHPQRQRVEVVGHWAHGAELVRFYDDARHRFFALRRRVPALVTRDREPGEDD